MAKLEIDTICKRYGAVAAITDVNLSIDSGEFLTLLGPSGCGKSTTLFSIAGLDQPTSGRISLDGKDLFNAATGVNVPAEQRNCGMVFQSYALWPHMTVEGNVSFPLEVRRIKGAERARRVREALELVEMEPFAKRHPHELSGGQQQRVALARTLAFQPALLLLDEPLSNLDALLRVKARIWLKGLQQKLGLTTIYVTHDQSEALSLSDRIAVMQGGRVVQVDSPRNIYREPASRFVADFVGSSNFLEAEVLGMESAKHANLRLRGGQIVRAPMSDVKSAAAAVLAVRPEHIRLHPQATAPGAALQGRIVERSYLGARWMYSVELNGATIRVETDQVVADGPVWLSFSEDDSLVLAA